VRVLLVHNRYRSGAPGGEDLVFDQELDYLRCAGFEVAVYERSNDEMSDRNPFDVMRVMASLWGSSRTRNDLSGIIRGFKPDVAHFHNLFPLIGVSAFETCSKMNVPVVATIHNYRLVCAAATHFRDGQVCAACSSRSVWQAVTHRCYRKSAAASAVVAASISRAWRSGVYDHHVSRFIVLTEFASQWLQGQGISKHKIRIKPNAIANIEPNGTPRGNYVVFSGRLSIEKGLWTLLDAWGHLPEVPLKVVGSGPLEQELRKFSATRRMPIEFLGYLPHEQTLRVVSAARAVVVPSLWFEGMPLSILEAWACGTPVVGTRLGGIAELLGADERGLTFSAGDGVGLAAAVKNLLADPDLATRLVNAAHQRLTEVHSVTSTVSSLRQIYREVVQCVA
jgi:glycosyltransferase involved in cell wall biosynthesis